jgi:phosphatidylinositol glycan class T
MEVGWKANYLLCIVLYLSTLGCVAREQFDERLAIKSLRDGKVASTFSFKTVLQGITPRNPRTLGADDVCAFIKLVISRFDVDAKRILAQHYTVFPLALGQILREYAVTELHLTLNAGNWNYDRWGRPEEPGVGTGAELWAWMGDGARIRCVLLITFFCRVSDSSYQH